MAGTEESEVEVDDDDGDDFVEFKDPSQPMALVARQPSVAEQHTVAPSAAAANHNLPAARNGWTGRPVVFLALFLVSVLHWPPPSSIFWYWPKGGDVLQLVR